MAKVTKLHGLVGFTLVSLNDSEMIVEKDGKRYTLEFDTDGGDCCGYAEISTELLIDGKCNPVITNVQYNGDVNEEDECDSVRITFFGANRALASIYSEAGSGSGWAYGSCATVTCKALGLDEILTSW